jgi:hypothetical protein
MGDFAILCIMQDEPIGTIELSRLTEQPSASAERALRAAIVRDLALTPQERAEKALRLGVQLRQVAEVHAAASRSPTRR